jgi:hypothetical protein
MISQGLQLGLKTWAAGLPGLGLKTRGRISGACGIIRELASRQSDFMKGTWRLMYGNLFGPFSPPWLSGSSLNLGALLELCNSHMDKYSGCPGQTSLPPQVISGQTSLPPQVISRQTSLPPQVISLGWRLEVERDKHRLL